MLTVIVSIDGGISAMVTLFFDWSMTSMEYVWSFRLEYGVCTNLVHLKFLNTLWSYYTFFQVHQTLSDIVAILCNKP